MLSGGQLAGGNTVSKKAENDYYATDPETVSLFLDKFHSDGESLGSHIWEPACGGGNICNVIKEYYPNSILHASDVVDRGYMDTKILDFLASKKITPMDTIITNPPFSLLNDFIKHGLEILANQGKLIFLAKIQTLEGTARKMLLENNGLKYVYVHSSRQATWKNGEPRDQYGKRWATTMCMAWFVWEKGYKGIPSIRFL